MRSSWAQPSLSRDFILLSAAVLFLLFFISGWMTYTSYVKYSAGVAAELEKDAARTDHALAAQMENANYLLTALGKQIIIDPDRNLTRLAEILKSFDSRGNIYTLFSWVNPDQRLAVSSSKGVLEKPIDVSDRDYVKNAFADPWRMTVGSVVRGRASGRWVIPVAMGLTDYTGKFIGALLISIDADVLTDRIGALAQRDGIDFAIVSRDFKPVAQMVDGKEFVHQMVSAGKLADAAFPSGRQGLVAQGSPFWGAGTFGYYYTSKDYPYAILLRYDPHYGNGVMRSQLWSRLLQMVVMAGFFMLLLWVIRARMIRPVLEMTAIAEGVAKGEVCAPLPAGGPMEMEGLAAQIRRISEYLEENKRIEDELRNKMFMFKKAKEQAEMDRRSKAEFMAYVCQEMRTLINAVIGAAQVMKDQLYGPIENRKYRQYAVDIYTTGNQLLDAAQNVLIQSKAEAGYVTLDEQPVDIQAAIDHALTFLADKAQSVPLDVKVRLQDPMPRLVADEFRLRQILINLLLYVLKSNPAGGAIILEARVISENKDKIFFAITLSSAAEGVPPSALVALADRIMGAPYRPNRSDSQLQDQIDLGLELAKVLISLHGGVLDIVRAANGEIAIAALFGGNRIRIMEG